MSATHPKPNSSRCSSRPKEANNNNATSDPDREERLSRTTTSTMKLSTKKSSVTKSHSRQRHSSTPRGSLSTPLGHSNRPSKTPVTYVQDSNITQSSHTRAMSDSDALTMSRSDKFWYEQLLEVNNRLHAVEGDLDNAKSEAKAWKKKCRETEAEKRTIMSEYEDKVQRLEIHYGQQLEALQRMHADKCDNMLREMENLRRTNDAFRKQLQRHGIAPVTTIPMEYEKHEHGVLNEEHRNFIETVYRTVTLSSDSTQECAENLLSSIERTAYALDYELKMLKFNHARLKIDKIQPSTTDDDQPALPSENAILMDLPLATTHPKPSEETIDHTADFSSTTEFRVRTEPNNFTGTQKPKAQTMDNFKKAIPSIFLRKSLEKRKEIAGQPVYDRDETEDVDLDGAARRHDTRSRRRSMVLNDTLNSADQAISSQRGTSSGTVRRGGRQDKSAEVHVTSSISCGIPLSSKRSATKLEASTSFAGHKTRSADEISVPTALPFVKSASDDKIPAWNAVGQKRMSNPITETPRTTITSRPQTPRPQTSRPQTPSELISSNSTSPNTFDRQRTESTPPPPVYPSRRSLDHKAISRPPSPDAIVPVSSTIVDQPMNAIVRRSSGSKTFSEFVVSEVELPPLSLDFQAMRRSSSKSNLNAVTMKKTEATATLLARSESPDPSVKVVASNSPPQSPSKWAKRKQVLAVLHKQSGLGIARDFVNDNVSGEDGE